MNKKIKVAGVGCCLVDRLYTNIPFTSKSFSRYLSKERCDGGLTPDHLVFKETFEKFSGVDFQSALKDITKSKKIDKINIGEPVIVARIRIKPVNLNESEAMTIVIYFHLMCYRNFNHYYLFHVYKHMRSDFREPVSYNLFIKLMEKA